MDKNTCGAKARSNGMQPCKLSPLENGRCRFHGGLTPIKHGFYTKKAIAERREFRALMQEHKDALRGFNEQY
jgi:hypothetical protein